jgi:hypothetical protein
MTFTDLDQWSAQSDCKLYFVCLARVQGKFRHTAWFKANERAVSNMLGTRESREEAEELCRGHAKQRAVA